jgi:predicted nucleic acid-binding protein
LQIRNGPLSITLVQRAPVRRVGCQNSPLPLLTMPYCNSNRTMVESASVPCALRKENTDRLVVFLQAPVAVLPFEPEDAEEAGELRAELRRAGTPIGPYDLLVAAQARRRGAVLVTANAEEFARVPGLKTQDWTAA